MVKPRLIKMTLALGLLAGVGVFYTWRQNSDRTKETAPVVKKTPMEAAVYFFAQLGLDGDLVHSGLVLPIKVSLSVVNDRKGWCENEESETKIISTQEDLLESMVAIKRVANTIENREVIASEQNTYGIYGNGPCEEPNIKLQFSSTGKLKGIWVIE